MPNIAFSWISTASKPLPLQRRRLQKSANLASLSSCMYVIDTELLGCWSFSIREPSPPDFSFFLCLCVHVFVFPSFPHLPSQVHPWGHARTRQHTISSCSIRDCRLCHFPKGLRLWVPWYSCVHVNNNNNNNKQQHTYTHTEMSGIPQCAFYLGK